jgi:GNAT superfamily N-acetyltransferase
LPTDISKVKVKPFDAQHNRRAFCCTNAKIQNYFRNNVRAQNDAYMVRAFVACEGDSTDVLGFYYLCLSSYELGEIDETADDKFQRVQAVPAVYLGMIGVHAEHAKMGVGKILMKDALMRTLTIAENAGTYALALDALDESLVAYYQEHFGFQGFRAGGLEMFLPLKTIQLAVSDEPPNL